MKHLALALLTLAFLLQPASAQSTIFLVRHAEKAVGGDARDPDLSPAGHERAQALASILKDAGISAIFVTDLKRTQQTAEPFAKASNITPTIVPAKETGALVARLKATSGNALVVGHSNTIPDILAALGISDPPEIADEDYDNLFLVTLSAQPRLLRLHF